MDQTAHNAEELQRTAVTSVGDLVARIAELKRENEGIPFLAINATLHSARMGEPGNPLRVIVQNIREYADKLALAADEAVVSAQLLAEVASSLPGLPGSGGSDVDANTALAAAAGRTRHAADVAEGELAGFTGNIARVAPALDRITRGMHFKAEIGEVLRERGADVGGGRPRGRVRRLGGRLR
jgi:hypothetical protein